MAAGDIVPVAGEMFELTLASARPDVPREMIREFARRMMDADVEARCNAGYGEVTPDRVNSRNGYRRRERDTRHRRKRGRIPADPRHRVVAAHNRGSGSRTGSRDRADVSRTRVDRLGVPSAGL